ncbi:DoxX family protein [Nocardia heshunensis]
MIATIALAALLAILFLVVGISMVLALDFQRANAAHLGYSVAAFRRIGVLALLGAVGVLLGLAIPAVGVLAAIGLVAMMAGAVISHRRAHDGFDKLTPPIATAIMATVYLVLVVLH